MSALLSTSLVAVALISGQSAHAEDAATISSAPLGVAVTRANESAVVRWAPPASNGGSAITGYTVKLTGPKLVKTIKVSARTRSANFAGLVNGRSYLVALLATNAIGNSEWSVAVKVVPANMKADVPERPIIESSSVSSGSATINFSLGNNNGSTITLVQYSIDGGKSWVSAIANPIFIPNLTNGRTYTVLLRAKNYVGFGGVVTKSLKPIGVANTIGFIQPTSMIAGSADQVLQTSADGGTTTFTTTTPNVCSIVAGKLRALAIGSCTVVAHNLGNATYNAARDVPRTVIVTKGSLTITLLPLVSMGLDSPDQLISASAAGGINVITSTTPAICSIVAGKIHPISVGVCRIAIANAGNSSFSAAVDVERAIMIAQFTPTITARPTTTASPTSTAKPTSTPTVGPTSDPTPTATSSAVPEVAYVRLTDADKASMTDHSDWWTNEPQSHSWVKFVSAGDTLDLHYRVISGTGTVVSGVTVTLRTNPGGARFSGNLNAVTNEDGIATFSFINSTDSANAEPRPELPSTMNFWDSSRKVSPEVKYDFTPTVGATTEHLDRVWTHTVRAEGWAPPTLNKTLLWSDEFKGDAGSSPTSSNWFTTVGDGCAAPDNNCGWGNGERQTYAASANKLDGSTDGNLIITASRNNDTSVTCYYGGKCDWISGKLTTYGKASFTYGYLETRAKIPPAPGAWPAFWMLGTDVYTHPWPLCGEIDIMENLNSAAYTNWGTAHWARGNGSHIQGPRANTTTLATKLSEDYHTYGILWKPGSITWYVDDFPKYTLYASDYASSKWPFGKNADDAPKFYAILNVAMGGQGGTPDPSTTSTAMSVDYVRYYSVDGVGTLNLP